MVAVVQHTFTQNNTLIQKTQYGRNKTIRIQQRFNIYMIKVTSTYAKLTKSGSVLHKPHNLIHDNTHTQKEYKAI